MCLSWTLVCLFAPSGCNSRPRETTLEALQDLVRGHWMHSYDTIRDTYVGRVCVCGQCRKFGLQQPCRSLSRFDCAVHVKMVPFGSCHHVMPTTSRNLSRVARGAVDTKKKGSMVLRITQNVLFVCARQPHNFRSPSWLLGHVRDALVEELPCSPPWKSGGRSASSRSFV